MAILNPDENMPELTNRRQELFCLEVAAGSPLASAYRAAGYKEGRGYDCRHNASRLHNRPHIKARLAELRARGAELAEVGIGWIQRGMIAIAEGREPAKVRNLPGGKRIEEFDKLGGLTALARTVMADAGVSVAVGVQDNPPYDPLEINDATRIKALESFLARIEHKQPKQQATFPIDGKDAFDLSVFTDQELEDAERILAKAAAARHG